MPPPADSRGLLALSLVSDIASGTRNVLRSTCRDLRDAIPAAPERLDDAELNPSFARWVVDGASERAETLSMVISASIRRDRVDTLRELGAPLDHRMVQEAVRRGSVDSLRWLRKEFPEWTDEGALAQCIRWGRFELVDELGLNVSSGAYIHAAAANSALAVDWLVKRGVPASHNLASFAAAFGSVEVMERAMDRGIGGSSTVAFKAACNRERIPVLEALWRRGVFDNFVFSVALKTGSDELLEWARSKRPLALDPRNIIDCLVHVIKRDDLKTFLILYAASPYHCLSVPMIDGVRSCQAGNISKYLETQYGAPL
eukprot:jgi/Tetstr1/464123/TSEL_008928.t1